MRKVKKRQIKGVIKRKEEDKGKNGEDGRFQGGGGEGGLFDRNLKFVCLFGF